MMINIIWAYFACDVAHLQSPVSFSGCGGEVVVSDRGKGEMLRVVVSSV